MRSIKLTAAMTRRQLVSQAQHLPVLFLFLLCITIHVRPAVCDFVESISVMQFSDTKSLNLCRSDLLEIDQENDNDWRMTREEYAAFLQLQTGNQMTGNFENLSFRLESVYFAAACWCEVVDPKDSQCCTKGKDHIPLDVSMSSLVDPYLDFFCQSVHKGLESEGFVIVTSPPAADSDAPSSMPSEKPTVDPTMEPTATMSLEPSTFPTMPPHPIGGSATLPTTGPFGGSASIPTLDPLGSSASLPTPEPSLAPSIGPTLSTETPSMEPTLLPTTTPRLPTDSPTTASTSSAPSMAPTTDRPSTVPTVLPTTRAPSDSPSRRPSTSPSSTPPPSSMPTMAPTRPTLCVDFQYVVRNQVGLDADTIFAEVNNSVLEGLKQATKNITIEILNGTYPPPSAPRRILNPSSLGRLRTTTTSRSATVTATTTQQQSAWHRHLAYFTDDIPVIINSVSDNPLCSGSEENQRIRCGIVSSTVCIVLEAEDDPDAVRTTLITGLRTAVDSGEFLTRIPPEYLVMT